MGQADSNRPALDRFGAADAGEILVLRSVVKYSEDQPRVPAGHPDGGQWTDGGAAVITHEGFGPDAGMDARQSVVESAAFKAWFRESKVVEADGTPRVVYHGTTHDYEQFLEAGDERLNPEGDWGAGLYFSDSTDDIGENYATDESPDLTNRIEHRTDDLTQELLEGEMEGVSYDIVQEEARRRAEAEIAGPHGGAVMPVYLSMQNPFVLGQHTPGLSSQIPAKETYLDTEVVYEDPDDPDSDIIGLKGDLPKFFEALKESAGEYEDYSSGSPSEMVDEFRLSIEENYGYDGITATELDRRWRSMEVDISNEQGQFVKQEVFRRALERMGFDGVIDRTVWHKFGRHMHGISQSTTHYIAFRPTQIKSAIGNTTFDPQDPRVTRALKYSEDQPRVPAGHPDGGQWTDGSGGEGDSKTTDARTFTSEEGYQWHETGARKEWAATLDKADVQAVEGYAGFGYTDMNHVARGGTIMKVEEVRSPTPEEFAAWRDAGYDWSKVDPPADGRFEGWMFGKVVRDVEDTERMTRTRGEIDALNEVFDEKGYVLDEDITVGRAAYYPGVHFTEIHKQAGTERTEGGFTSTMVGDAGGRLEMYVANGKAESIYRRHGKIDGVEEIGTAVLFNIRVPKGSRVVPVEAVRQRGGRDRSESELLLRSGARFRVTSVEAGGLSKWVNFQTSYLKVNMEYLGEAKP